MNQKAPPIIVRTSPVNGKRIFWIRNKYPNENMFHKDEKFQWNKFLSEWLIFSQKEGLSSYIVKVDAQS